MSNGTQYETMIAESIATSMNKEYEYRKEM